MPAKPAKPAPGRRYHLPLAAPALALAVVLTVAVVAADIVDVVNSVPANANATPPPPHHHRHNDRAPHSAAVGNVTAGVVGGRPEARSDHYQLISTSGHNNDRGPPPLPPSPSDKVASADLPVADKQYDYPLVRPMYAPFVTRPAMPSYAALPYVEILDHHRDPPYMTHHKPGSPMVSTVVVQDMSQTPMRPQSSLTVDHEESESVVDNFHHLSPTKIPFTGMQVVTKPLGGGADTKHSGKPNFTNKLEEASLEDSQEDSEEDIRPLISDPENLDVGGIVEDVVRKVFREHHVLYDAASMIPSPGKAWPCPPVTCCTKASRRKHRPRKCSTFVKCITGRSPECPVRSERVPQALALTKPSNGYTAAAAAANGTDPDADVRDGEPRFKKKKILKKKKKLLKKFLLPLLLAYKLLFMLIVPLLVNGMMMMMGSSGMAGFFFALIGASVTMVRLYSNTRHPPPPPPPHKVVKVIKYVEKPAPVPSPTTTPAPAPAPPATVIHHQPFVDEHFPTYHAPHPPTYGSYYPHPYWNRHYDRSEGALNGGRKRRRRIDDIKTLGDSQFNGVFLSPSDNQLWIV